MGLSLRKVVVVLDVLGIDRSHRAVRNWTHDLTETQSAPPTVEPLRVAIDGKQIEVDGEARWLYAAIDTGSKCIPDIDVYSRRGTDPVAAFLHQHIKIHQFEDPEYLVDGMGYLTALARHNLSGHLDYNDHNYIEKGFQTVTMRIDRLHPT
jgi:transposase-like protein